MVVYSGRFDNVGFNYSNICDKMVQYCVVPQCKNSALTPGISLHRFPNHPIRKKSWIIKIRRDQRYCKNVSDCMRVCSAHFVQSDYRFVPGGRKFLRKEADPSVFSFSSTRMQKMKRKPLIKQPLESIEDARNKEFKAVYNKSRGNSNFSYKVDPHHHENEINKEFKANDNDDKVNPRKSSSFSYKVNPQHHEDDIESSNDAPDNTDDLDAGNSSKRRTFTNITSSVKVLNDAENSSVHQSSDREKIFSQYVISEMKTLRDDPLLYLQMKQAILEILTNASFELINAE